MANAASARGMFSRRYVEADERTGDGKYRGDRMRNARRIVQVPINAQTGQVGPGTQVTGDPTYQALRFTSEISRAIEGCRPSAGRLGCRAESNTLKS
jgi:hypothetical protein